MARREVPIDRTGSAGYLLKGAQVYRRTPSLTQRYDTLEDLVTEMLIGALGGFWRESDEGRRIIDRFVL